MEIFRKVMEGQQQRALLAPGDSGDGMNFTSFRAALSLIAIHKGTTESAVVQMVSAVRRDGCDCCACSLLTYAVRL